MLSKARISWIPAFAGMTVLASDKDKRLKSEQLPSPGAIFCFVAGCYNAPAMISRTFPIAAAMLVGMVAALGCAAAAAPGDHTTDRTVTVFAAASLTESLPAVAAAFEVENPGVSVAFNFAGSQTLRTQLEHGASADVFASANWEHMASVKKADLLGNTPEYFAANRLTVATPAGSTAVQTLEDLARPGVSIAVAADAVPAGAYTRNALDLMSAAPEFPDDFAAAALANVVTSETSVRAVAQKVALGEVDAGLIYETDAAAEQYAGSFRLIPIPLRFNPAAQYPIATLAATAHPEAALAFIAFIQGDQGQSILREYGFAPPTNVACPCAGMRRSAKAAAVVRP